MILLMAGLVAAAGTQTGGRGYLDLFSNISSGKL